ncbi:tetratricopeptide repeat protein [Brevundimonas sp. GN22]
MKSFKINSRLGTRALRMAYGGRLRSLKALRDWPNVVHHLTRIQTSPPRVSTIEAEIGYAYRQMGQFDLALMHYRNSVRLDYENVSARYALACLEKDSGNREEAIKLLLDLQHHARYAIDVAQYLCELGEQPFNEVINVCLELDSPVFKNNVVNNVYKNDFNISMQCRSEDESVIWYEWEFKEASPPSSLAILLTSSKKSACKSVINKSTLDFTIDATPRWIHLPTESLKEISLNIQTEEGHTVWAVFPYQNSTTWFRFVSEVGNGKRPDVHDLVCWLNRQR